MFKINRPVTFTKKMTAILVLESISTSPLLLLILIDVLKNKENSSGAALFADDGAMWKKGSNVEHIVNRMQQASEFKILIKENL